MKKLLFCLMMTVFTLALLQPAFAELRFKPISEITDFELDTIELATKTPVYRTLENAEAFVMLKQIIVVRFKNGLEGYYGYGKKIPVATESDLKDSLLWDNEMPVDADKDPLDKTAKKIFDDFATIWNNFPNPDFITTEEIMRADDLMSQFFSIILQKPSLLSYYILSIGYRGNRYRPQIENLATILETKDILDFYDSYIKVREENAWIRTEDRPQEVDIKSAVQKFFDLLGGYDKKFKMFYITRTFLEKYYPYEMQSLEAAGKI